MKRKLLNIGGIQAVIAIMLLLVVPSCKKYYDPPPYFEAETDTVKPSNRKLLIIAIDGAAGREYKKIAPPVLTGLEVHSKFSWDAVSDEVTTDAASWETLMTGVSYSKHGIYDSSFIFSQPITGDGPPVIKDYPSFFSYILSSSRSDMNTSFVTQWGNLLTRLVPQVENPVLVSSDEAVKDSTVARIKNTNSDLIVADFNSVCVAGRASSFSATAPAYKDAVLKVDSYIGELMTALKSRPEYNKSEEWLVIITGTHGGVGNSYGGGSADEANVVSFYYNENFLQKEFIKGGSFSGVAIQGTNDQAVKAQVLNDGGLYDPGTGEQTIQIKIRGTAGAYPHFFSKMAKWPSTPGWSMFTGGSSWAISVRSTTSGEIRIQPGTPNVFDGLWHTLTVVFADSASKRWVRRYTDGVRTDQTDISSAYNSGGTFVSPSPLTIGWGADPGMPAANFYPADAMIFDTALSDDEIKNNVCLTDITKHPEYANLIGYWPASDAFGGSFSNNAPGYNFPATIEGNFKWDALQDLPCSITPAPDDPKIGSLLVKSVDLVTNSLYWLKIPTQDSWGLDGTAWLTDYEIEFLK